MRCHTAPRTPRQVDQSILVRKVPLLLERYSTKLRPPGTKVSPPLPRVGHPVIADEVFLDGERSQARLAAALQGLTVLWVGVRCDPDVAETRGIQRGDRLRGQARDQALRVHQGVRYDLEVDTTRTASSQCAGMIVEWLTRTDS